MQLVVMRVDSSAPQDIDRGRGGGGWVGGGGGENGEVFLSPFFPFFWRSWVWIVVVFFVFLFSYGKNPY